MTAAANHALLAQQQALLQALWQPTPQAAAHRARGVLVCDAGCDRGLRAYRSNGRELAQRALAGAYPAFAQLLGEENFAAVATRLWLAHPPRRGDLAQWGGELAGWIERQPDLAAAEPYLADVARLEWRLHVAATAADATVDAASFACLQSLAPDAVALCLAPGTALLASPWPAASIVLAHTRGEPSLAEAGRRLQAGVAETALVWRQGWLPRLRVLEPGEPALLTELLADRSLDAALAAAPQLDFAAWLARAVQDGLVTGARPWHAAEGEIA